MRSLGICCYFFSESSILLVSGRLMPILWFSKLNVYIRAFIQVNLTEHTIKTNAKNKPFKLIRFVTHPNYLGTLLWKKLLKVAIWPNRLDLPDYPPGIRSELREVSLFVRITDAYHFHQLCVETNVSCYYFELQRLTIFVRQQLCHMVIDCCLVKSAIRPEMKYFVEFCRLFPS